MRSLYTHGVLNLGVSAFRCALYLFFPNDDCMDAGDRVMQEQLTEKKHRLSRSKLSIFRLMPTGM